MKKKITVVDFGLNKKELSDFISDIKPSFSRSWSVGKVFSYKDISKYVSDFNNSELVVIAPGNAPVGLIGATSVGRVAEFVELTKDYFSSLKPVLGINAGHQFMNASIYGHAISKLPDNYNRRILIESDKLNHVLFSGMKELKMNLTNIYGVWDLNESLKSGKQLSRPKQLEYDDILSRNGFVLVSKGCGNMQVSTQFGVESGTKDVFYNYFRLVSYYIDRKKEFISSKK